MATTTYGENAASAIAYLTGSGNVVPRCQGDAVEIRRQSDQLYQWAKDTKHLINFTLPPDAPRTEGAEHEVFFDKESDRVFKRTYPGTFGSFPTPVGLRRTATPYFYLRRLILANDVFYTDFRLEGIIAGDKPSVLISQSWAHPADPNVPIPTALEIQEFMIALRFSPMPDVPYQWFRDSDSIHIADARPDNFIRGKYVIVPIDLIMGKK